MNPVQGIVFDLYGTLCDVHSVVRRCESLVPGRGTQLSALWRQKQLEYSWLRSLMDSYADFDRLTADALTFAVRQLGLTIDDDERRALCDEYLRLTPFPEVPAALDALKAQGLPLAVLSNGTLRSVDAVLRHAGLHEAFAHLLSVDALRVFKPHPAVYELGAQRLGLAPSLILFVSSNGWDVTGASQFGFMTVWVNRSGASFDEMGRQPTHTVNSLDEIAPWLQRAAAPAA